MSIGELYDAGYAIPLYSIETDVQHWQYREEKYQTTSPVRTHYLLGVDFGVAKIEDVRRA